MSCLRRINTETTHTIRAPQPCCFALGQLGDLRNGSSNREKSILGLPIGEDSSCKKCNHILHCVGILLQFDEGLVHVVKIGMLFEMYGKYFNILLKKRFCIVNAVFSY